MALASPSKKNPGSQTGEISAEQYWRISTDFHLCDGTDSFG
jgi:hypothetical protein